MTKYDIYQGADHPLPSNNLIWNLYGAGIENVGKNQQAEKTSIPEPGKNQLLVRIDAVGMCFSDIKVLRQGGKHPKLYNRDLLKEPGRLGHEVSLTVIKAGEELKEKYHRGQRFAVQPDIYQNGISTAYGYTIPGGLIQYHLIGPEVLDTDQGPCLLPIDSTISYAGASMLEPWGCVLAAYTQRRRLKLKTGGILWIIGQPDDRRVYQFSEGLDAPETIVLTNVPDLVYDILKSANAKRIVERNDLLVEDYKNLSSELTGSRGFDDIILLNPRSAFRVSAISRLIARRGTLNLVGETPLDGLVEADVGRLHYDYIAFLGNPGPDIAASYGELRNRCDLKADGSALFIGAGGPMGQMHVQRALEMPDGPINLVVTEINNERLSALKDRFLPLAEKKQRKLFIINPQKSKNALRDLIYDLTDQQGVDDVVVTVPSAKLMAESASLMNKDGMLVLFAGVPNGTMAPLNLSNVYLHNAQYTGTSGLTMDDQAAVLEEAKAGKLSPGRMVAAIGGMDAVLDAINGVIDSRYPGKIIIFPQIKPLPLIGLDELEMKFPDVTEKLDQGIFWTVEAEAALFENLWNNE